MYYWLIVALVLETSHIIHALYVDEKCYHTNPCHLHTLKCNENLQNKKSGIIAIAEAKFGFKTATCTIEGCSKECCKEKPGDCFEPFSKNSTIQKRLYDQCEFREECSLNKSYRIPGCKGEQSTYSRIEYECLQESSILRTTGWLLQKKLSLLFTGSDPNIPNTEISCSIRTRGTLRVTHYYTRLTRDGSKDQVTSKSDYFDRTDCKTRHKMFLQVDDGSLVLCHDEGEFFYSSSVDFKDSSLNLVINQLDDTDVIWIGFYAPQAGSTVEVYCNQSIISQAITNDTEAGIQTIDLQEERGLKYSEGDLAVIIGGFVGGLVFLNIIVIIIVVLIVRKKLEKQPAVENRHYSSLHGVRSNGDSNYDSLRQVPVYLDMDTTL